jgi:3-oxoacyl-[acyl-carrier-protein] synthase-1
MMPVFVRAAALACSLGPDLATAVQRLSGKPLAPDRAAAAGADWPYFPIPVVAGDWTQRAGAISRAVAADLRGRAALKPGDWEALPCFVGSSSLSAGAWDAGGREALRPPLEFSASLATWFGARGPVISVNTACTSGLSAFDIAANLVAAGECGDALVLGVEFANRMTLSGFAGMELLSRTAARPCDRDRDGLVLGEALGAVLVSATPGPWRVAALASQIDAANVTGPPPGGEAAEATMRSALDAAGWRSGAVDLVKLQAGGGPIADLAEARALRRVFAAPPAVVSLKGALGHTLGASGPVELALLLECLAQGRVPATWGFETPDEEVGLEPAGGDAGGVKRVLFNLSGFGGNVMSLALERTG